MVSAEAPWPRGSLLAFLGDEVRADLLRVGTLVEFAPGNRLLSQGERGHDVFLLLEGCAKVSADTSSGTATLLTVRVAGDLVGELAALGDQPRIASVTAASLVRARRIGGDAFLAFLHRHPGAALAVTNSVATKLRWSTRRRVEFGAFPVPVRLARVVLDLAGRHGTPVAGGLALGVPLSQPELAELIGAAEPSVHRALRDLKRRGVLAVEYRRLIIKDLRELIGLAGLD